MHPPYPHRIWCHMDFPQKIAKPNHQTQRRQDKEHPDEPLQTHEEHSLEKEGDDDEAYQQGSNGKHVDGPARDMPSPLQHQ